MPPVDWPESTEENMNYDDGTFSGSLTFENTTSDRYIYEVKSEVEFTCRNRQGFIEPFAKMEFEFTYDTKPPAAQQNGFDFGLRFYREGSSQNLSTELHAGYKNFDLKIHVEVNPDTLKYIGNRLVAGAAIGVGFRLGTAFMASSFAGPISWGLAGASILYELYYLSPGIRGTYSYRVVSMPEQENGGQSSSAPIRLVR